MRLAKTLTMLMVVYSFGLLITACEEIPAPTPSSEMMTAATPLLAGTSFPLESTVYGDTRTINVYLPSGYDESKTDYPVLYLVDGGYHQDYLPMVGMAALGPLSGQYRSFILVGVQSENRQLELTAPSTVKEDNKYLPINGGSAEFRRFLATEVKPFIAQSYRTSGEDGIIGESLAALFITETFLRAPDSFDHFIAISPSLWWRDMGLSLEAAQLLQAEGFPKNRSFYLTVADEGGMMIEGVERLATALEQHAPASLNWWYEPMPEEHHNTIYNPATLRAFRHIFAAK